MFVRQLRYPTFMERFPHLMSTRKHQNYASVLEEVAKSQFAAQGSCFQTAIPLPQAVLKTMHQLLPSGARLSALEQCRQSTMPVLNFQ